MRVRVPMPELLRSVNKQLVNALKKTEKHPVGFQAPYHFQAGARTTGFLGSGRPRAAGKPLKKVGRFAPHLFEGFPGPPGPPRPPKSRIFPLNLAPPLVTPPCGRVPKVPLPRPKIHTPQIPREMALELVSGADFWCKLMSGGRPVDLRGPGVDLRAKTPENRPENFDFYPPF